MKRLVLVIISALICGMMFISSCNKEESNSALSIYTFGQLTTRSAVFDENEIESKGLWCTGNDIEWYNGTTGELKLKNVPKFPEFPDWAFFKLTVFLDDIELFSLDMPNPISSQGTGYCPYVYWERGEIEYSGCLCGNKQDHFVGPTCGRTIINEKVGRYYIFNSYLTWTQEAREQMASVMGQDYVDDIDKEKEKEAFELGWDKFIEQLKKEGKYRK